MSLDVAKPPSGGESGQRFGDYIVERRLATGGMAEIYLARREGIEDFAKKVVLKRIRPELAAEPRFVRMFLDEARLAATLQHHNIATVYDIGEENGEYFFAMEYLDGVDARTILKWAIERDPIRLEIALGIVGAIASGLHHAHQATDASGKLLGIVHRDISPSNVFITYDGAIKLMDFGIAKAQFSEGRTGSGTLKGKAPYMSPEQIRGDNVDRRSDIFSLGVVLFELATSSRLFRGKTEFQIFRQIVSGKAPNPRALDPSMSPALAAIISKALSRKPERRYKTAQAFARALDAFVAKEGLRVGDFEIAEYVRENFSDKEALALAAHAPSARPVRIRPRGVAPASPLRRWAMVAALVVVGAGLGWVTYDRLVAVDPPAASAQPVGTDVEAASRDEPGPADRGAVEPATVAPAESSPAPSSSIDAGAPPVASTPRKRRSRRRPTRAVAKPPRLETAPTNKKWDPSSALPPPRKKKP